MSRDAGDDGARAYIQRRRRRPALAADMNIIIALCIAAVYHAAPHAARSVAPRRGAASLEAEGHAARDDIAELLIPLLERSFDETHEGKHKKVIQLLPYEGSEEHENKGWRKLKSNKKQLVEITPLRRGVGNDKHLAYILSSAKPVTDVRDSATSEQNSFEDSVEFDDERSRSAGDAHRVVLSEGRAPGEKDAILSHEIDDIDTIRNNEETVAVDNSFAENFAFKESENYESKEINNMISREVVSVVDKSEGNGESEHVDRDTSEDAETSVSVDRRDLLFGPGNNILFERGSSESASQDDYGEANEDVKPSGDDDEELGGDGDSPVNVVSGEVIGENEVVPDIDTVAELEAEALDASARDYPADGGGHTNDLDKYKHDENDFAIDRSGNTYDFEGKSTFKQNDSRSRETIELLRSVEGKESKYNCDKTERDGEPRRHGREHKSYRLSFLFNK